MMEAERDSRVQRWQADDAEQRGPELTIIVPTWNERDNVGTLVERLTDVLTGIDWEVIFADDDSSDGTIAAVRALAQQDRRVRLLHRIGRRGLSSACIEAAQASTAPYFAVIDGDLQHDEALLPRMLASLRDDDVDVVVGSRYVEGGGTGDWDRQRVKLSGIATWLSRLVLRAPIADPMSGFFMLRREVFDASVRRLSALGFKILVDILASSPKRLKVLELPYQFRRREAGESKLSTQVAWEFLVLLLDKTVGLFVPIRFVMFSVVGSIGLAIHLLVLRFSFHFVELTFLPAQITATVFAMISNFLLNNLITYSDQRLEGWRVATGLLSFTLICAVGAFANIATATYLFDRVGDSFLVAGLIGAIISAVWNYAVSSVVTWRRR